MEISLTKKRAKGKEKEVIKRVDLVKIKLHKNYVMVKFTPRQY